MIRALKFNTPQELFGMTVFPLLDILTWFVIIFTKLWQCLRTKIHQISKLTPISFLYQTNSQLSVSLPPSIIPFHLSYIFSSFEEKCLFLWQLFDSNFTHDTFRTTILKRFLVYDHKFKSLLYLLCQVKTRQINWNREHFPILICLYSSKESSFNRHAL